MATVARLCGALNVSADFLVLGREPVDAEDTPDPETCPVCGRPVYSGICSGCGVATLSISYEELGRITGEMAVQILTGEADVSELASQYGTAVTKMYNATNCEALGITVPDGYQPIE